MGNHLQSSSFLYRLAGGISYRLRRWIKPDQGPYQLSRVRKVVIKHQPDGKDYSVRLNNRVIYYNNSQELLHCYKEILISEIYKFEPDTGQPYILDCGANIGVAILYFKDLFPGARIIAFEPDTRNYQLLQKNTAGMQGVVLEQKAVWTHDGFISFDQTGTLSSKIVEEENGSLTSQLACVRLYNYLHEKVDFLKIDIEGAEYAVLKDCADQLSNVRNLFIEYHGNLLETARLTEMMEWIKAAGFAIYIKEADSVFQQPFLAPNARKKGYEVQLNIFCFRLNNN